MKADKQQKSVESRRQFLKGVAVAGGAAAVTVAAGGQVVAQPVDVADAADKPAKGYHVTQHVIDYYRSTM